MEVNNFDEVEQYCGYTLSDYDTRLLEKTIFTNPYIPEEIRPYPKQLLPIVLANRQDTEFNKVLTGGKAYGGKSVLLTMLALQYAEVKDYKCLVIRKNYQDLIAVNSIFDNIMNWCGGDKSVHPRKTAPLRISFDSGAKIDFLSFDQPKARNKLRGTSYHRIIGDETSQIDESVLRYTYRSLRKPLDDPIPLSTIFASNPLGVSNQYHVNEFVTPESPNPYIPIGYPDNPFIDTKQYEKSLLQLPKVDRISQMSGDWSVRLDEGLLIDGKDFDSCLVPQLPCESLLNIVSVDFASTGKDKTALTSLCYGSNGYTYLVDSLLIPDAYVESLLLEFLHKQVENYNTYAFIMELEPGSASEYSSRYWSELIESYEPNVLFGTERPTKSKFERTRLTAHKILKKELFIVEDENTDELREEFMYIHPDKEKMRERGSPDLLDSTNQGVYVLDNMINSNITMGINVAKIY